MTGKGVNKGRPYGGRGGRTVACEGRPQGSPLREEGLEREREGC